MPPASLHIVQVIDDLSAAKGGPSRTVLQLSEELSRRDLTQVSILCCKSIDAGTTTAVSISKVESMLVSLRRLGADHTRAPQLFHDNGLWLRSNVAAAVAAATCNIPLVITPHGMLEPWALEHRGWKKSLAMSVYQRWCLSRAAALHATSDSEALNIRRLGIKRPIAVVSNGIANPLCVQVPTTTNRIALFLSRIHPKKGVLELVRAWGKVGARGWKLRIVGPDENGHLQQVLCEIASLGLQDEIEMVGEVDDQTKWLHYRQASLFVLPTYSENFGLVIGEALACGVPVITTTATPWREIERKGCGWIVEPGVPELTLALAEATALDREQLSQKGRVGREWVPIEYSWTKIAKQMQSLYAWILDGAQAHSRPGFLHYD